MPYLVTWTDEFGHKREKRNSLDPERIVRRLRRERVRVYRIAFFRYGETDPVWVRDWPRFKTPRWEPDPRPYRAPSTPQDAA